MRIEVTQRDSTINVSTSKGKGPKGDTPYIQAGTWWISGEDTGITAVAQDGVNPEIGQNGNWHIGDTDTGVTAQGPAGADAPIPEFRTYYPPPIIEDPVISVSATIGDYTASFNQAVQQQGVFQWKYTSEDDTAWRDQYAVPALTGPLTYSIYEGDVELLNDIETIETQNLKDFGDNVSQFTVNAIEGDLVNGNILVEDQAGNKSIYQAFSELIPERDVFAVNIPEADFTLDEGGVETFDFSVTVDAINGADETVTVTSSDPTIVTVTELTPTTFRATLQTPLSQQKAVTIEARSNFDSSKTDAITATCIPHTIESQQESDTYELTTIA